ncbi:hypothetical protein nbrc107696_27680 [Gordonia spumicola]|uniref:Glycosyl transferase n=1 Tax=Gordonia spumicola TaxID=589161 RepID=A0A7I9VAP9_9ACTN|nr:hypothetical protein nbrc107696_27680 [Gordonia spumicola]
MLTHRLPSHVESVAQLPEGQSRPFVKHVEKPTTPGVGVALGFAFLTKMLQGLIVLPAFGLAYLLLANTSWRKRIGQLAVATLALIVSAGWFVVVTMIVPASARPYIGGSTDNTFMDLVLGYNGIGRISGDAGNGGGPGGAGTAGGSFGGETGLSRLFGSEMGNEISWLLPVAVLALVFLAYVAVRSRFDGPGLTRMEGAAAIAWGGWLLVTAAVFSYMSGTIHPYYTVALAPAIGAVIAIAAIVAWRRRDRWDGRLTIAAMIALAAAWSIVLLNRNDFGPTWCRWALGAVALIAALTVLVGGALGWRQAAGAAVIAGSIAGFAGTASFAIATATTPHSGSIPTAVSTSMETGGMGGPGGMRGGPNGAPGRGRPTAPADQGDGQDRSRSGSPGSSVSADSELAALLRSTTTTWAAATNGSQSAAGIEIASGKAVMAIGGWSGDPAPTLDQFKTYVQEGKIGYYIGGQGGDRGGNSEIAEWVAANFTASTIDGQTVYKLI